MNVLTDGWEWDVCGSHGLYSEGGADRGVHGVWVRRDGGQISEHVVSTLSYRGLTGCRSKEQHKHTPKSFEKQHLVYTHRCAPPVSGGTTQSLSCREKQIRCPHDFDTMSIRFRFDFDTLHSVSASTLLSRPQPSFQRS